MGAPGSDLSGAVLRVERICDAHDEERPMRIALVEELRRSVGFGSYAWALTDPQTEVGVAPLADVPGEVFRDLPRLIRARYLTTVNRASAMAGTADSLVRATGGDPAQSLLYREVLAELGVGDVATVVLRDPHGCWGWVDLWRSTADPPFSDGELERLAACAPPITAALRRCHARTFETTASLPERPGPVVLVLSPDLRVRAQTPETDAYLRALLPPDGDRRPIPAGAYNVAAQLVALEEGVDARPPTARMRLHGGVWLTLRAARVEAEGPRRQQDIAVSVEPSSPAERRDLFCRANALSPRETEVVELLAGGADTRVLASTLFLSEHTVQDHLKSIFAKTGARNRRTLLARLAGA